MKNALIALTVLLFGTSLVLSDPAPDFAAKDIEGKEHYLFQYLEGGQFVLLDFFASY